MTRWMLRLSIFFCVLAAACMFPMIYGWLLPSGVWMLIIGACVVGLSSISATIVFRSEKKDDTDAR